MPATILAIDTATEFCSVALTTGGRLIERAERVGQRHSERVLPMIEALLREGGRRLSECEAIAFGAGPGAFTGLRIACGIAQGLAYGAGRPVVAVGNLAALARAAVGPERGGRVLAAIDARMRQVYWAVYDVGPDTVRQHVAPSLAAPEDLPQHCVEQGVELVAGNAVLAFPTLAAALGGLAVAPDAQAGAGQIARLAEVEFAAGRAVAPAVAAPVYVRDRVAQTIRERQEQAARR